MSDTPTLQRPRQVTMAAWMVIAGSGFLVATAFERVASFHHLETREALTELLAEPPVKGLGLDLEGALVVLQAFAMVTAGCAAAAMILGYHVLKRHRGARLALTVLAVPLFLSGMVL